MFEAYTTVDDQFLRYRQLVIDNKTERSSHPPHLTIEKNNDDPYEDSPNQTDCVVGVIIKFP